jgi:uncharacterized membrane protein (UPF0127 family)
LKKILLPFFLFIITLLVISCNEEQKQIKQTVITFNEEGALNLINAETDSIIKSISIEIADDEYQTQTGLMYRDNIKDSQGMLFIFPDAQYRSFYMKNTKIPLDILYFDEQKKLINIQKNTQPFKETSLPSKAPAKYVLEINAGLSDLWKIKEGDRIEFTKH